MNENEAENADAPQELLLRADEVDAGTTVLSPRGQRPLSALDDTDNPDANTTRPKPPPRPVLRREGSAPPPPPPSQPPPAPPEQLDSVTDSLSLPQLRQLVSQFPKIEQRAYAFNYQDAEDFVTEIDEWFHYTSSEQDRDYLLPAQEAFQEKWEYLFPTHPDSDELTWIDASDENRSEFLNALSDDFDSEDITVRSRALAAVLYIVTGVWGLTAGLDPPSTVDNIENVPTSNVLQVQMMHENVDIIIETGILNLVYADLRNALNRPLSEATGKSHQDTEYEGVFDDSQFCEMSLAFSIFYIVVESARARLDSTDGIKARQTLLKAEPNFLAFLTQTIARLRWDESYNIPLMHALQLLWKAVLLSFGDVKNHLEKIKSILQPRVDPFSSDACKPILTASPLDYHLFRQEITSKYPAYNPPLPLIPLEIEQKTILPPLPHQQNRPELTELRSKGSTNGGSIMHQPVHIATPAPSPPPSPGGPGGKGGKKQNYQTNQNFPFLYPPLDSASNNIGGKGSTADQDVAVGRKWEGSDIPASIIEAGELFASRMRMTRAMRQLWHERDLFLKYDRGWKTSEDLQKDTAQDGDDPLANDKLQDADLQQRMDAVESYFHDALPDLQSLVIVMMKVMLTNVQDIAARNGQFQDNQPQTSLHRTKSNSNLNNAPNSLPMPPNPPRPNELSLEDLDNIRSRETSQKAISACLFLLLKWFKISHILKFEYMTQLLLDSNYIQLTLKYFAHQNIEDLVSFKYDRDDLSFWRYCQVHSDHPPLSPTSASADQASDHDSEDDAIPPPIQRHRRSPTSKESNPASDTQEPQVQKVPTPLPPQQPIVDELGNPLTDLPSTPITTYSSRQFHTSISLLRVLQKLTRSKSHRVLLLVQFKSSQILRRVLRVPEPMLRLYVLKLFKSQVPYCGRKWRQSNMRVITAIYLHCRPELRDEWLAGMHDNNMEGEVEEAVPLEWSLRGLTFWWQKRVYKDVLKLKAVRRKELKGTDGADGDEDVDEEEGGQEIDGEERDFFQRELDAMGWGLAALGLGAEDGVGFGEEAPGVGGEVNGGGNSMHWGHMETASPSPGYNTVSPLEGWQ